LAPTLAVAVAVFQQAPPPPIPPPPLIPQAAPQQPDQQKPPPPPLTGSGIIVGQVVDSDGAAVPNALVTMPIPGLSGGLRVYTTSEGRFAFTDLPKGTFTITAAKSGYASGSPGRRRPGGSSVPIVLNDAERIGPIRITVWRYASLSGTLLDDAGEPLVGATIWSLTRVYTTGRPKWNDGPSAVTDDRGVFRFGNLAPGDWTYCVLSAQSTMPAALVEGFAAARAAGTLEEFQLPFSGGSIGFSARIPTAAIRVGESVLHTVGPFSGGIVPPSPREDGQIWSFPTTCYPNTLDLRTAEAIRLAPGEERTGADVHLKLARGVIVEGTVVGPNGPVPNAGVRLAGGFSTELMNEPTWESALTVSDSRGRFVFLGVPPGPYTVRAQKAPLLGQQGAFTPTISADPTLTANFPLVVGPEGISNLTVRLANGHRITGRIVFEGAAKPPELNPAGNARVYLVPADGHSIGTAAWLNARIEADGTFATNEVPPGRYMFRAFAGGGGPTGSWTLRSVMVSGREVYRNAFDLTASASGVVVTFTDSPSEVSGTVRGEDGKPDATAGVVIFSVDRADWTNFGDAPGKSQYTRPNASSFFRVRGLPPGNYFIAAVDDALLTDWLDPRVLEQLSRIAERFTLGDLERKTQDAAVRTIR
jgi:hypothetical protein